MYEEIHVMNLIQSGKQPGYNLVWEDGEMIQSEAEFLIPKTKTAKMYLKAEILIC